MCFQKPTITLDIVISANRRGFVFQNVNACHRAFQDPARELTALPQTPTATNVVLVGVLVVIRFSKY